MKLGNMKFTSTVINAGYQLLGVNKHDSVLYANKSSDLNALYSSTDSGETWEQLYRFAGARIDAMEVLDNGYLIVQTQNGNIHRSTDGGANWDVVATTDGYVSNWGGLHSYDNIVLIAPYQNATEKKAYASTDYGLTWREIFHVKEGVTHIHTIAYDPYESLIWIVTGDHRPADSIFFSPNFGRTWERHNADKSFYRCTNIMPLPDSVLFGTDENYISGFYKHVRPKSWTTGTELLPHLFWAHEKNNGDGAPNHWATRPAMTYGDNALGFFGFLDANTPTTTPAKIFMTDGERVVPIWVNDKFCDNRETIMAVFCDDFGKVYGNLHQYEDGILKHKIVIIDCDGLF